ncbi:MAG: YCF48-related protein [Candidatus Eisenbacteria bacterium]
MDHRARTRSGPFATLALLVATACPVAAQPEWKALPAAPVTSRTDDLHFVDPLTGWIATGDGSIFRTLDGGNSWDSQFTDGSLYFRCIRFADAQRGWAGTLVTSKLLYATTNGGADWSLVTNIPAPRPNALCGMAVPSSQVIYGVGSYSGPARVIKSSDGGLTWSAKDLAPLATTLVDVHFASELEGIVVGSVGTFPSGSRAVVMRTTDGGATWQQRWLGSRVREWGWKISFPTPDTGYVSLERPVAPMSILKTVDRGVTWTELPFEPYNEQGIGFATPRVGWVGGSNNPTFGTTDGGVTWTETPWGDYLNRLQFLSPTLGYGAGVTIYKYALGPVSVPDRIPPRKPALAALPNPFGPRTTIRYDLADPVHVRLFVADPAGRVVRSLVAGTQGAGSYRVDWDGKDDAGREVAAGIYLYVLHAGDRHEMGKLVRVR